MKFKDLLIGERFNFTSETNFPFSGMEKGPWRKTSARMYKKETMKCQVGSINVEVRIEK